MSQPQPQIKTLTAKKLVGKKITMSLTNNKTGELWQSFIPLRHTIPHQLGSELYSLQIFKPDHFKAFNPNNEFVKWAAVEVSEFDKYENDLSTLNLPSGLYAVFHYKGSSNDPGIFQYIYSSWLPQSEYSLDDRPHFELLGDKYKNNDPESEEEIWIPIKHKTA
ncbi:AraC family transcriptional regulator [Fulvivirga sp. RKSG066]|uniref:GyrI-like domain-containing protein n=1 Tax=Fulvivirga aurantia TaxID=2529383 RepID=UPI0012BCCB7D|nr:GyrI-like domain-containing protein [Fulvivirga aurantia]MTI22032.1 AraC family transcriptional regulator [Fulvivirga aurantia]